MGKTGSDVDYDDGLCEYCSGKGKEFWEPDMPFWSGTLSLLTISSRDIL
jgi:hypothetical protein